MLRSMKKMLGCRIKSLEGTTGYRLTDLLFDDLKWNVRHLVINTEGRFLPREVLIPPGEISEPEWKGKVLPVRLTRDQVEESPGIETDLPVSRQHESNLPLYCGGEPSWMSPIGVPFLGPSLSVPLASADEEPSTGDPHLRSLREVTRYRIQWEDGEMGHVGDFMVLTQDWVIPQMIADTRIWFSGERIALSPTVVNRVDYLKNKVYVRTRYGSLD